MVPGAVTRSGRGSIAHSVPKNEPSWRQIGTDR
jgi:hypothetical protein